MNNGISVFTSAAAFAVTMAVGIYGGTVHAEEVNINPGMWETTSKMEVTGMPPEMAAMMQKPPKVEKDCVKDKNYNFDPRGGAKGCDIKTSHQSSKKLSWDIKCSAEGGNASGRGEAEFKGNTMSGWFEMNMQGPAGPMKMRHTFEGKRLGSC